MKNPAQNPSDKVSTGGSKPNTESERKITSENPAAPPPADATPRAQADNATEGLRYPHMPDFTEREGIADPHRDVALEYAWKLYETYSTGSKRQKENGQNIRQWIILLILLTSGGAVLSSLPGSEWIYNRLLPIPILGWFLSTWGAVTLSVFMVILSVTTSAFLAFASQFTPMKAWIMYRVGADRIRREIYLYRMMAGEYRDMERGMQKTRDRFLKRLEAVNRLVYEMETVPPFLQRTDGRAVPKYETAPRKWLRRSTAPFRFVFRSARRLPSLRPQPTVAETAQSIKVEGASAGEKSPGASLEADTKPKRLPGRYKAHIDDGFNLLTGEAYYQARVVEERDWYVNKVWEDYTRVRDWRIFLLALGALSAVLAASRLEPYIVITTAAVVAVNTYLQLNLIGSTYGNYHITASRIDAEVTRWRNLPEDRREDAEEVATFVERIEHILEDERSVWMQQASQALQETEQALVKGTSRTIDDDTDTK